MKLLSHMRRQHIRANIKCHICFKSFEDNRHLKEHVDGTHAKTIKCEKCKIYFKSNGGRTMHIMKNRCKLWTKTEIRLISLKNKTSTKKADLNCKLCSKTFNSRGSLRGHISSVHEKKHKECQICGISFRWSGGLWSHLRLNRCKGKFVDWSKCVDNNSYRLIFMIRICIHIQSTVLTHNFDHRIKKILRIKKWN